MREVTCSNLVPKEEDMTENPVEKDAQKLVNKFAEKKSTKFDEFKSEWLKCKFYYMHCLGKEIYSKAAIIESIYGTMTERLLDSTVDLYERLGCLYLCYSLYSTQPNTEIIRIRITLKGYEALQAFHAQIRAAGTMHEANFILCKLKSFSAFLICACQQTKCMGHQNDTLNIELNACGYQPSLEHESDVMINLRTCHKLLKGYEFSKESISDHLPLNLMTKADILDKLTDSDRLKLAKDGDSHEQGENTETDDVQDESRRSRVLTAQYQKAPEPVNKLK